MSVKNIYNRLTGKTLKRIQEKGFEQQGKVDDLKSNLNWVQKNITGKGNYRDEVDRLQVLDKLYDSESKKVFRDRVLAGTLVGAPLGGAAYSSTTEKRASTSRLMNILRGTHKKELDEKITNLNTQMGKAVKDPSTSDDMHKALSDKHDLLRKERLKEKAKIVGTYTSLGSIPVIGAGYALNKSREKEASLDTITKLTIGGTLAGGGIGAGINLADKGIENSASNIAQSAALGAGAFAVPGTLALLAAKNPNLRKKLEELRNKPKGI